MKKEYTKIKDGFLEVKTRGYGVVIPNNEEIIMKGRL